jgi:hypothetical protein
MRIIHLSDLHLTNDVCIWGTDTNAHFTCAIDKIKGLKDIDAVVISGDLSNEGSIESYMLLDRTLATLDLPVYCCPGNHDNLDVFFNKYNSHNYRKDKIASIEDWDFIFFNTVVEGMSRGFPQNDDIALLKSRIQHTSNNIAIVLHHPPIEQPGWLNRKLLEDREAVVKMLGCSNNVKLVLYGHTHYHMNKTINGILYSSASSTGFAFDPTLPKFEIAARQEAFSLISIENDNISIENISIYS